MNQEDFLTTLATTLFGVALAFAVEYANRYTFFQPGDVLLKIYEGISGSQYLWPTLSFTALTILGMVMLFYVWKYGLFRKPAPWALILCIFFGFLPWVFYWVQYLSAHHWRRYDLTIAVSIVILVAVILTDYLSKRRKERLGDLSHSPLRVEG